MADSTPVALPDNSSTSAFEALFVERICKNDPLSAMAAHAGAFLLAAAPLQALFDDCNQAQYTRKITFPLLVSLLGEVVIGTRSSVRTAYEHRKELLGATLAAVYQKLQHVEAAVSEGLVRYFYKRAKSVMAHYTIKPLVLLPGFKLRIVDGNHPRSTHRKIKKLRGLSAGPLPSSTVVVYDPQLDLPEAMLCSEDAYEQERALTPRLVALAVDLDCWVFDRNFCTRPMLFGLRKKLAHFLGREHQNLPLTEAGPWSAEITNEDGDRVSEQAATVKNDDGEIIQLRRIRVELVNPTRDGESTVFILTTLPVTSADTALVARLYLKRWLIETAFQRLEALLNTEIDTLGYPKASLFGMAIGWSAYTMVSLIQAAIAEAHGVEEKEKLSWFHMAFDIEHGSQSLMNNCGEPAIEQWSQQPAEQMAATLVKHAKGLKLHLYRKVVKKNPSKKPAPRTRFKGKPHVSTHRILNGTQKDEPGKE